MHRSSVISSGVWLCTSLHHYKENSNSMATYLPSCKPSKKRQVRHAGYCWRRKDEVISNVLLCRPSKTYIPQLRADIGCHILNLPRANRDNGKNQGNLYCQHIMRMVMIENIRGKVWWTKFFFYWFEKFFFYCKYPKSKRNPPFWHISPFF